jgi:hypothetical protein
MALIRTSTGLLLRDQFDRADGAPGASYDSASGTWSITSNKLRYELGTPLIRVAGLDVADVVVQAVRPFANTSDYGGWRLRHAAGGGSYIMFDMGSDTGQLRCRIYRWTGATYSLIAVSAGINHLTYPGAWLRKTVLVGTMAYFYLDGVLMCSGAVPAASGVAGANEVWLGGAANVANTFDDLVLTSPTNGVSITTLPAGWKLRAGGVTATESGGEAAVDVAGATFPLALVEVLDGANAVQDTFSGEVWGGDEFEVPAPTTPTVSVDQIRRTTVHVTPSAYTHPGGSAHAARYARVRRVSTDEIEVAAHAVPLSGPFYLTGLPQGPEGAGGRPAVDPDLVVEVMDEDELGMESAWGTSAEFQTLNLWESGEFITAVDVLIERPDGAGTTMQSCRDFGGRNWIRSVRLEPASVNTPIGSCSVVLYRQVGADSLAPLVTESPLNQDGGYAPALDFGREIEVRACNLAVDGRVTLSAAAADVDDTSLAVEPTDRAYGIGSLLHFPAARASLTAEAEAGATTLSITPLSNDVAGGAVALVSAEPTDDDWLAGLHWRGITDDPDWPRKVGDVTVPARDYSGRLADAQMRFETHYGSEEGEDAFDVLQAIADDYMGAGQYVLDDQTTGARFAVTSYPVADVYVWDAMQTLALQWGGKALRQVDGPTESGLAVIEPDREKTDPDYAVGPGSYLEVHNLGTAGKNLRTIVRGRAVDKETGEIITAQLPAEEDVDADPLVDLYGPLFYQFDEEQAKGIDNQAELDAMVEAIYADLTTAVFPIEPETRFASFAAVDDLVAWGPNTILFDQPLNGAVLGLVHSFPSPGVGRTNWSCGGAPKGAWTEWLARGADVAGIGRRPSIYDLTLEHDPLGFAALAARFNAQVDRWFAWAAIDEPVKVDGVPQDRFLVVQDARPQTRTALWSVRDGTVNLLVRAMGSDGTFVELTRTLEVTGVGAGPGEAPYEIPGPPFLEAGVVDGAEQEVHASWVNTSTTYAIEAEYFVGGVAVVPIRDLAAAASSDSTSFTTPARVRMHLRYTAGPDLEGRWSDSSNEVRLMGGLP